MAHMTQDGMLTGNFFLMTMVLVVISYDDISIPKRNRDQVRSNMY